MSNCDRMRQVVESANRRRTSSPEHAKRIDEYHSEKPDWQGVCHYCKQALQGTKEQLLKHSCKEFEASREASS